MFTNRVAYADDIPLKNFPNTTGNGAFVKASNAFAFRLLWQMMDQPSFAVSPALKNVFLSPLSLSIALTMAMDGASGATRQQMKGGLGYSPSDSPDAIDSATRTFLASLSGSQISPDVAITICSGLWPNLALPPNAGRLSPEYAAHTEKTFGAAVQAVDFSKATGARQVNEWVRKNTVGKIAGILPERPLGRDTSLILTNTANFKARWNHSFRKTSTQPGDFTLANRRKKTISFMAEEQFMPYMKGKGFQAIQRPYDDGRFCLYVLLPDQGVDLRTFASQGLPSVDQWNGYLLRFSDVKVNLALPRFKIAFDAGELARPLSRMGMPLMFDKHHADFRPMGFTRNFVSSIFHKTTLSVDEQGSEATAATGITANLMGGPMHEVIVPFAVDRPFFCAIRDNATGAIPFMGWIADPDPT